MNLNITQTVKIEKIQRRITKYICFKMNKFNLKYNQRLDFLNLKSLECRRKVLVMKIVYKCINRHKDIPNNWLSKYIISENDRNGRLILKSRTRNEFCDKNFFIYSIDSFNQLPRHVRDESNFKIFLTNCENFYSNCN
jgi:hypothetical protein